MNKDNEFRISGWYVPKADKDIFNKIKKSGLNHIFLQGSNVEDGCRNVALVEEYLTLCDECGLDAYVQRGRETEISYVIDSAPFFAKHPSFKGFLMYDEPSASQYSTLREDYVEYAKKVEGDFFVNMLPSYARGDQILDDYKLYVQSFSDELLSVKANGQKWISFDFYPLMYSQTGSIDLAERWLFDTQIIANERKKVGCKSNAFVQTMPFSYGGKSYGSREIIPSYADLSLQVYTYLAFGFDSISYFCVGTPEVDGEFRESHYAMFNRDGAATEIYDSVALINKNISGIVKNYVDYTWVTTYMLGNEENDCYAFLRDIRAFSPTKAVKDVSVDGNVLLGTFEKEKSEALVLVNFGSPTLQKNKTVEIQLEEGRSAVVWRGEQSIEVADKNLKIELAPGEGAFVEIKEV
ncbi:MAG: hypothetical protein IJV67_01370 [Clostridia bacterium]|nr:hypothetical protein [Clostridia bacterium]